MIRHTISKFQLWLLRKIVRANLCKEAHHQANLVAFYYVISEECEQIFYEDNLSSQIHFQRECMFNAHHERVHDYYLEKKQHLKYPEYVDHIKETTGI